MANRPIPPLIQLNVRPKEALPLHRQIYEQLRQAMLHGILKPGARLQSSRELADELGVSRNTVANAYDQLLAEGYIHGEHGSGTYVSSSLPDELLFTHVTELPKEGRVLSSRGAILAKCTLSASIRSSEFRPFNPGVPDLAQFPFEEWQRIAMRRWRDPQRELLDYAPPAGYPGLREAIAEYLRNARAVKCEADQIIVVSGTQQGLDLCARLLLDPGDAVWMEDPGYLAARAALLGAGARIVPVPVDPEGLDVSEGERLCARARLVYASPSHQYPVGVTMTLRRRLALLEWASRSGAWIIEDDYDSDFRYSGRPLPALQGLDAEGRVIYIGTFSKVLFPSLRLGYLVVPRDIVPSFLSARAVFSRFCSSIDQAILCDFIRGGHFTRHIRRMRNLYAKRQSVLVQAAERELRNLLEVQPDSSGIHLIGWLPDGVSDVEASAEADKEGVEAQALSAYAIQPLKRSGLVLGYAAFSEKQIREALHKLAVAVRRVCRHKSESKTRPPSKPRH